MDLKGAGRSTVSISAVLKRSAGAVIGRLSVLRARQRVSNNQQDEAEGDGAAAGTVLITTTAKAD